MSLTDQIEALCCSGGIEISALLIALWSSKAISNQQQPFHPIECAHKRLRTHALVEATCVRKTADGGARVQVERASGP